MKFTAQIVKAYIIAPMSIMVVIPGIILWTSSNGEFEGGNDLEFFSMRLIAGLVCMAIGLYIVFRSALDLTNHGQDGTPAPWDPPENLIVKGIYKTVRNPMVCGISVVLLGEEILLGSLPLLFWVVIWILSNMAYTPLIEEPELTKRFGDSYLRYKKNVPRWVPVLLTPKG